MVKQYIPNAFLKVENSQVYAVFSWSNRPPEIITATSWLTVLEIFVHQHDIEAAYQIFQQIKLFSLSEKSTQILEQYQSLISHESIVLLRAKKLTILERDFHSLFDEKEQFQLGNISQGNYQILVQLFSQYSLKNDLEEISNIEEFTQIVIHLEKIGLLSFANHSLDWGDFKRNAPICQAFGFLRGQPIDRYYRDRFIEKIRPGIIGKILEIGALKQAKEAYQLNEESSYHVLNLEPSPGVDIVGDVHDVNLIKPESFDTILLFSVLEHCYAPWIVMENIYRWLKPGGKCFATSPVSAKIHNAPKDYWRILPDAFTGMLKDFSQHEIHLYGNPMTVLADIYGISAEELTTEELDAHHPDHPVSVCIAATK